MANFALHQQSDAPANGAFSVTPADADFDRPLRGFYVGSSGNVHVTTLDGSVVTFIAVPTGQIMPVACIRIWADTSAGSIVGLY